MAETLRESCCDRAQPDRASYWPSYFFCSRRPLESEQDREDARHTIDRARRWLEESTAEQREALDLQLVSEPWFFGGPCALTTQFLTCILEENSGAGSADEMATVLKPFDSLEVATDNPTDRGEMRFAILRLLAILLDASMRSVS
ncbi:hypothetical protein NDA10_005113 [Ustilago hordei]|nr:hypothetical protein NDA10_005113 [Ustilago hordei]